MIPLFRNVKTLTKSKRYYDNFHDAQREIEIVVISSDQKTCPFEYSNRKISVDQIREALRYGYGNSNVLKTLMCVTNSTLSTPNDDSLSRMMKIRDYLKGLSQLGDKKNVMISDNTFFVVKGGKYEEMLHEYFIGVYGTNKLRDKIPNFAYIFGKFECSPVYLEEMRIIAGLNFQNKSITYCSGKNNMMYILYENIDNSVSLKEYVTTCTLEGYLNILCQIVLAIDYANREIGFTHYDLHVDNVLVRDIGQEIFIPYVIEGKTVYLKTRKLAVIIDYGFSHIIHNGKHFGYSLPSNRILPDTSFPMHDIYKIFSYSLLYASAPRRGKVQIDRKIKMVNPQVFDKAKKLLLFFVHLENVTMNGKEAYWSYLIKKVNDLYAAPYSTEIVKAPVSLFYNELIQQFPAITKKFLFNHATENVYGCSLNNTCIDLRAAMKKFTSPLIEVESVYDLYSAYSNLNEADRVFLRKKLFRNKESYFKTLTEDFYKHMTESTSYVAIARKNIMILADKTSRNTPRHTRLITKIIKAADERIVALAILNIYTNLSKIVQDKSIKHEGKIMAFSFRISHTKCNELLELLLLYLKNFLIRSSPYHDIEDINPYYPELYSTISGFIEQLKE